MGESNQSSVLVPDVLATLAQLPNDEVYTPPRVANLMLDCLPAEVWSNPTYRWLDPATKSGVFLREAAKRLMVGLTSWEPDPTLRRHHILKNMLFGSSITALTAELSRRSLYQTKDATGKSVVDKSISSLIVPMASEDGNIVFVPTEHTMVSGKCSICRAPESLVRDRRENFAYSFIHNTFPSEEFQSMKFDVIVGNPPYQIGMEDSKGNRTANITPLYNMFVERAMAMEPRYVLMITPSRWFAGGKGLNEYRDRMLNDRRIREIVDIPDAAEVFTGVEIKGGVSYFLWDSNYSGDCNFRTFSQGGFTSQAKRDLRDGSGVVMRDNFAATIVKKIASDSFSKGSLAEMVSARDPFGQSIKSNYSGAKMEPFNGSVPLVFVNRIGYVIPSQLERNHHLVDRYKVLLPKAYNGGEHQIGHAIYGEPIALAPGSACTQTYLIAGDFDTAVETVNYAQFLTTKFCRFLVAQRKISQNMTSSVFAFVPKLDFKKSWSDPELYALFSLNTEEIAYIERAVSDRSWINSIDSNIPETHLPGGRKYKVSVGKSDEDEAEDDE